MTGGDYRGRGFEPLDLLLRRFTFKVYIIESFRGLDMFLRPAPTGLALIEQHSERKPIARICNTLLACTLSNGVSFIA
jgi:hypothetical protein